MTEYIDDDENIEDTATPVEEESEQEGVSAPVSDDSEEETVDSASEATEVDEEVASSSEEEDVPVVAQSSEPEPWAIGVSFRQGGKVYYFAPAGVKARKGDYVLVRTEKGVDIAQVVRILMEDPGVEDHGPIKPLVRKATAEDLAQEEELQRKEREAMRLCAAKIAEHGLPMKLVDADYSFDSRSLVFFFSSDGRVDFRELVRDLAKVFRTRIELRQIGVRDEAKMLGGIGSCGRPLCCMTFLRNFDAVGIKVAKDQGLSLNPSKISGVCDRLMCCLRYEHEQYCEMRREAPREGSMVSVPQGQGRVVEVRILTDDVIVELEDGTRVTVKTCQVSRDRRPNERRSTPRSAPERSAPEKVEKAQVPAEEARPVREREPELKREPEHKRRAAWERRPKRKANSKAKTAAPAETETEKAKTPDGKQAADNNTEQKSSRNRRSSRRRRRPSGGNRHKRNSDGKKRGGEQDSA